ncbi:MAG: hypothetical protein ACXVEE_16180 [Polyangiales bacterium]
MSAYRSTGARPRICVPGVLVVDAPHASTPAKLLVAAAWDGHEDLTQWKALATFARARDLAPLATPDHPRLAALLAQTTLIQVVSEDTLLGLRERKVPLYEIGFARNADDYFTFVHELRTVSGPFYSLTEGLGEDELEALDRPLFLDRLLRAASDGTVDGHVIALAMAMGELYAAPAREALDSWERELAEIEAHAAAQREDAKSIANALEEAHGDEISIPVYGRARRIHHPAVVLREVDKPDAPRATCISIDGTSSISIPAYEEWVVDGVEPWVPEARLARIERERLVHRARATIDARKAKAVLLVIALVFLGFFILGILFAHR